MSKKLVPVALSSEIDEHGREHIHAAVETSTDRTSYAAPVLNGYFTIVNDDSGDVELYAVENGRINRLISAVQSDSYNSCLYPVKETLPDNGAIVVGTTVANYHLPEYFQNNGQGLVAAPELLTGVDNSYPPYQYSIMDVPFSRDGLWSAMSLSRSSGYPTTLYIMKRNGASFEVVQTVTTPTLSARNGNTSRTYMSPDGTYIVFTIRATDTNQESIYIYKRNGEEYEPMAYPYSTLNQYESWASFSTNNDLLITEVRSTSIKDTFRAFAVDGTTLTELDIFDPYFPKNPLGNPAGTFTPMMYRQSKDSPYILVLTRKNTGDWDYRYFIFRWENSQLDLLNQFDTRIQTGNLMMYPHAVGGNYVILPKILSPTNFSTSTLAVMTYNPTLDTFVETGQTTFAAGLPSSFVQESFVAVDNV